MSFARVVPVVAFILTLCAPLAGVAQTPPPPADTSSPLPAHHRQHRRHESMVRALRAINLTAAQQQQVDSFRDAEKQANVNADGPTRQANAMKLRGQIMGILTADQKAQLSAELRRSRQHQPDSAPMPSPAPSPGSN